MQVTENDFSFKKRCAKMKTSKREGIIQMKKLFKKDESMFAVVLIIIYVVGSTLVSKISDKIGIHFLGEAILGIVLTGIILKFICKNHLAAHVGLCKSGVSSSKMLFYVPLVLIATCSVWFGFAPQYTALECVLRIVMMFCVGFLEEIIFRGFLFRGMAASNFKVAVIVSSVTFGAGHIVNLLNGYNFLQNVCQILYAIAIGFLLVMIFIRTGSLIACILFHSVNNALSTFASFDLLTNLTHSTQTNLLIHAAIIIVLTLGFLAYIMKFVPKKNLLK